MNVPPCPLSPEHPNSPKNLLKIILDSEDSIVAFLFVVVGSVAFLIKIHLGPTNSLTDSLNLVHSFGQSFNSLAGVAVLVIKQRAGNDRSNRAPFPHKGGIEDEEDLRHCRLGWRRVDGRLEEGQGPLG